MFQGGFNCVRCANAGAQYAIQESARIDANVVRPGRVRRIVGLLAQLYTAARQKEKARTKNPPGLSNVRGNCLGQRAMRGAASGANAGCGASIVLPVRAAGFGAEIAGSSLRTGMARFSPSRTKVKRSWLLSQSMQTRSPR